MTAQELAQLLIEEEERQLSPERRRAVEEALEDPVARRALVQHYAVSAALRSHLVDWRENERRLGRALVPRRRARRVAAALAISALALLAIWLPRSESPSGPLASVLAMRGEVVLERGDQRLRGGAIPGVRAGDALAVSSEGLAVLTGRTGTVRLAGGTRLTLSGGGQVAQRLAVRAGFLAASVSGAAPLTIESVHATATLAAGELTFTVSPEATGIEVTGGHAVVKSRTGEVLMVAAGRAVRADDGGLRLSPRVESGEAPQEEVRSPEAVGRALSLTGSSRAVALLRRAPAALLLRLRGKHGNAEGMVGRNQQAWLCPDDQRAGVRNVLSGVVLARTDLIEEGLRVADATFARQRPEGDFEDGDTVCLAKFVGETAHGLLALREVDREGRWTARLSGLQSMLARAAAHLRQPGQLAELRGRGALFQAHLFSSAVAFADLGAVLADPALERLGTEFLEQALREQRADGAFAMRNGTDSSYQGVMLHSLARWLSRRPDPRHEEALARGIRWLRSRVSSDGTLDVTGNTEVCAGGKARCRHVDWEALGWALLYHGVIRDDVTAFAQAGKLLDRRRITRTTLR